ncbi:unnamed protein product [Linum tenue]|uniref:Uncharacterized protein n=1 Tax=Linum tenue TaxID=586396 RepID=A0AAV0H5J0_9ROSI|nr:unnamed protein product [Linum tenue]
MENDSPFDSGKKTTLTSLNQSKIDDLRGEEAGWRPPDRGTINVLVDQEGKRPPTVTRFYEQTDLGEVSLNPRD